MDGNLALLALPAWAGMRTKLGKEFQVNTHQEPRTDVVQTGPTPVGMQDKTGRVAGERSLRQIARKLFPNTYEAGHEPIKS